MICVALADDQNLVRQALRMHLDNQPGIQVVGDLDSGEALLELAGSVAMDVALIDIHMPGMGGLETMRRLRAMPSGPRILALSSIATPGFVGDLFRDGLVDGYLTKDAAADDLMRAVMAVAVGRRFICPRLASRIGDAPLGAAHRFACLTEREREVLMQVLAGHDNKSISQNLMLSEKTVSQHKLNALRKLGADSEIEAYRMARLEGWIE